MLRCHPLSIRCWLIAVGCWFDDGWKRSGGRNGCGRFVRNDQVRTRGQDVLQPTQHAVIMSGYQWLSVRVTMSTCLYQTVPLYRCVAEASRGENTRSNCLILPVPKCLRGIGRNFQTKSPSYFPSELLDHDRGRRRRSSIIMVS